MNESMQENDEPGISSFWLEWVVWSDLSHEDLGHNADGVSGCVGTLTVPGVQWVLWTVSQE